MSAADRARNPSAAGASPTRAAAAGASGAIGVIGAAAPMDSAAAPAFRARRALGPAILLALLALLATAPLWAGTYTLSLFTDVLIYAIFAMSYDLLLGYTGMVTFGHALFFGTGAYSIAILTVRFGWSLGAAVALGFLVSVGAAVLFGVLSLRVRGVYFAMVTLALAELAHAGTLKFTRITGGEDGITRVPVPQWLAGPVAFYLATLVLAVATYLLLRRVVDSPFGRTLVAIRENADRASSLGYPVSAYQLAALVLSAVLATAAGMMLALFYRYVSPQVIAAEATINVLLMTVVGGAGTLLGPVAGAALVRMLGNLLSRVVTWWPLLFGLVYVAVVLFLPGGLAGAVARLKERLGAGTGAGAGAGAAAGSAPGARAGAGE